MIERRHVDHAQLLELGKLLLLLVKGQELLVKLPAMKQANKEIMPIEELSRAS